MLGVYRKQLLPNYSVFDEQRYFKASTDTGPLFEIAGVKVAVSICEDAWEPGPIVAMAANGAELVVNINASPYFAGRLPEREAMLAGRARAGRGSDRLREPRRRPGRARVRRRVARVRRRRARLVARAKQFDEDLLVVDVEDRAPIAGRVEPVLEPVHEVYEALVLGTRDYVRKNGFTDVLISLSGGIDSSLVAAIAVDALGAEHVHGVMLPSRYSSEGSVADAVALTDRLGVRTYTVPIEPAQARVRADARRRCSRVARPMSPRRTCRRASVATP